MKHIIDIWDKSYVVTVQENKKVDNRLKLELHVPSHQVFSRNKGRKGTQKNVEAAVLWKSH